MTGRIVEAVTKTVKLQELADDQELTSNFHSYWSFYALDCGQARTHAHEMARHRDEGVPLRTDPRTRT